MKGDLSMRPWNDYSTASWRRRGAPAPSLPTSMTGEVDYTSSPPGLLCRRTLVRVCHRLRCWVGNGVTERHACHRPVSSDKPTVDEVGSYRVTYFLSGHGRKTVMFKKVDYPGRRRPEIFVLVGTQWQPASGLAPAAAGLPEWDPLAVPVESSRLLAFLEASGLDRQDVERIMASKDGQRLRLRKTEDLSNAVAEEPAVGERAT
jgi:hypothetical protein